MFQHLRVNGVPVQDIQACLTDRATMRRNPSKICALLHAFTFQTRASREFCHQNLHAIECYTYTKETFTYVPNQMDVDDLWP